MACDRFVPMSVERVQRALNRLGQTPPLSTDGLWGPQTLGATLAYLEQVLPSYGPGCELDIIRPELDATERRATEVNLPTEIVSALSRLEPTTPVWPWVLGGVAVVGLGLALWVWSD